MFWKKKKEDGHEFKPLLVEIEEEPLNPLGRSIFWIIIAAIVFLGMWMIVGKVDVVVTARGKVIPVGEVKTVQPLTTGVVRSIRVAPGDYVEQGQVIMEIDPSDIDPELKSYETDFKRAELEILSLECLLGDRPFTPSKERYDESAVAVQKEIYHSTRQRLEKQVRVKQEELSEIDEQLASEQKAEKQAAFLQKTSRKRLKRLEPVRDIISRDEYEQAQNDFEKNDAQLKISRHRIDGLLAARERVLKEVALIREDERSRLLKELSEKRQHYEYLKGKIERARYLSSRQQITSPVSGHVAQLMVHTIGGVVTPAEKLAYIVPSDSSLVIKTMVMNQDVGFIAQGMDVTVKIDAFNFQKYGVINGEVLQISKDSIEVEGIGLVYETYIRPQKTALIVEGVETPITTGMGITAEIKVGKRRIIEFFIYPLVKYLDEGISVR